MDNTKFTIVEYSKLEEILAKVDKVYELLHSEKEQSDKLYTNGDACEYLKVCAKTLQNYRDNGLLEYSQIGRKIYYKQPDLNTFLQTYKNETFHNQINKK